MPSGGGSMNDIEAGGAFIRVHTKDDATREMKVIFGNMKAEGAKAAKSLFSAEGAKTQLMSLKTLIGGVGLASIASIFGEGALKMQEFTSAMEEGVRVTARLDAAQADLRERTIARVGGALPKAIDVIPEGPQRIAFLTQQLDQVNKNLGVTAQNADKARDALNEFEGDWRTWAKDNAPFAGRASEARRTELKSDFNEQSKRREELFNQQKMLREQLAAQKLAEGRKSLNWWDGVVEFEQSIKIAEATMGKTAEEAQAIRMAMLGARDGIKDATNQAENLLKTAQSASKVRLRFELDEKSKGIAQGFEDQLMQRAGMSGTDVQMFRLEEERKKITGRLDPNLAGLAAMQKDLDAIDKFKAEIGTVGISKVKGAFGGDMRSQLGIGDSFTKPVVSELKNANEWLKKIAERELVAGVRFG